MSPERNTSGPIGSTKLALVFFVGANVVAVETAAAEPSPPVLEQERRTVAAQVAPSPIAKAGPYMVNVKAGLGVVLSNIDETFALQLEVGYAIIENDPVGPAYGDLYALFSPELHVGDGTILSFPIGIQYDAPTSIVGFYIYPRLVLGVSVVWNGEETLRTSDDTQVAFTLTPGLGIKYVVNRTLTIGLEPAVFSIHFGEQDTFVQYALLGYVGTVF